MSTVRVNRIEDLDGDNGVDVTDIAALSKLDSNIIPYDGGTVQDVLDNAKSLADYAALRAYTGRAKIIRITKSGIAGIFQLDTTDTTSADNGGTIIVSGTKRWKRIHYNLLDCKWFGAVADYNSSTKLGTDNTSAFQSWITTAQNTNSIAWLSPGKYYLPDNVGLFLTGGVTIQGSGRSISQIMYNNYTGSSNPQPVFQCNVTASILNMKDFAIFGRWGDETDFSEKTSFTSLNGFSEVHITGMWFKGSRSGAIVCTYPKIFEAVGNIFENCYRDTCRAANSERAIVTHNFFRNILDDAVSVFRSDQDATYKENSYIVTDNNFIDCQGILVGGGKVVTVANNHLIRPFHRAIYVGQTPVGFETGNSPVISINIHDNTIVDGFDGLAFSSLQGSGFNAIHIEGQPLLAKDTVESGNPVISPRPYMYLNNVDDTTDINAGLYNISVRDNTITRTLNAVTQYSDYGFGQRLSRSGWVNPAISLSQMMQKGINTSASGAALTIKSNKIDGCIEAIRISTVAAVNGVSMRDYRVLDNIIRDVRTYALSISGSGHIEIKGNIFDNDPYHLHPNRLSSGGWDSTSNNFANSRAINLESSSTILTVDITANTFKNVGATLWRVSGVDYSGTIRSRNVFVCQPTTTGMNDANLGICFVPRCTQMDATYIIEGCNPTDASTFRKPISVPLLSSSTIPTTGLYVSGHFVRSDASDANFGWKRLTTGSAHVLNTDWIVI